jgi:trehalose 6-phosphate synthase
MWTRKALHDLIESKLRDYRFVVVSNREPYVHRYTSDGKIECIHPASGMVSAIDPILRASGGIWIAHGSGDADRRTVDAHDRLAVPPNRPHYTLRRVWLTKPQVNGYYNGLANEGLWPLCCHMACIRPVFDPANWPIYREVNELFANAVRQEVGDNPSFVFIQDFHFGLVPRLLKQAGGNCIVAQFWHIPWPNPEVFAAFPWKEQLLDGLLGNDLLGFHLRSHCVNFLEAVERTMEARVDHERFEITRGGKVTLVRPFPIGIDFDAHQTAAGSPMVEELMESWRRKLGLRDEFVGIGIDRIDYTKGIPDRLRALDRFLEKHPAYRERLLFVQIGVPSRVHVRPYKLLDDEIDHLVEEINWKWSTDSWRPIVYLKRNHSQPEMMALHRLAHFCIVNSFDDGMNLVAKEYLASRIDDDGVLLLSRFTGAARELGDAVLVNPFAVDEVAEAMRLALEMSAEERRRRMEKLRAAVAGNNIYRWAGKILSALLRFDFPEDVRAEAEQASDISSPARSTNGGISRNSPGDSLAALSEEVSACAAGPAVVRTASYAPLGGSAR